MANWFPISSSGHYVCRECNRFVSRSKHVLAATEGRCDCGDELIALRPAALTFGVGAAWACIVIFGSVLAARVAPELKEMFLNAGLAITAALACIGPLRRVAIVIDPSPQRR